MGLQWFGFLSVSGTTSLHPCGYCVGSPERLVAQFGRERAGLLEKGWKVTPTCPASSLASGHKHRSLDMDKLPGGLLNDNIFFPRNKVRI